MLTIIARPTVEPTRLEEVKTAMLELVEATLQEEGCISYKLHQDNQQKNQFAFIETWENHELWQKHMSGEAIKKFNQQISGAIIEFELQQMSQIS